MITRAAGITLARASVRDIRTVHAKRPVRTSLETWSAHQWTDGVQLDELNDFACVLVHTHYSVYQLFVLNSHSGEITVRGGRYFPTYTKSRLEGSSMGGSLLKRLGIHVGFRLELRTGRHRLLTSRVQRIALVVGVTSKAHH